MRTALICFLLIITVVQVPAQELEIISFQSNGGIAWTNAMTNAAYQVEWASSLTGNWYNSWESCRTLQSSTSTTGRASVPMFYRLAFENVTGMWKEDHQTGAGGSLSGNLSLVQSGTNVAGSYNAGNGDRALVTGSVVSNSITLLLTVPGFPTVTNVGVVNANRIQGTWSDGVYTNKAWSATKQADLTGFWMMLGKIDGTGNNWWCALSIVQSGTNIAGAYDSLGFGETALISGWCVSNSVNLVFEFEFPSTAIVTNIGTVTPNQLNMSGTWSNGTSTGGWWASKFGS